ncbi:MAG: T9SS type A sorting domain-containing protein [Bacteroidetes bacterium]|nr:T9SS type A sorting domain-containing protein [Bacteroidota bacterium]
MKKIEVVLSDIAGRKVYQEAFSSSLSINTEQLAKGTYLYELRNKNGIVKIGKVVKD